MEMDYLKEFIVFSKTMSYSKAASDLFMSQPTLRAHMKAIEEEIGSPLTYRSQERTDLSPVGKLLLKKAEEIVAYTEDALAECREYAKSVSSLLVSDLGYPPFVEALTETKHAYSKAYPGKYIELRLSSGMGSNLESVESGKVDLALFSYIREDPDRCVVELPGLPSHVRAVYYGAAEMFFWASKENPIFDKDGIKAADLSGQTLVVGHSENMARAGRLVSCAFEAKGVSIGVSECPFSSYSEYRISGTGETFGITHREPMASNRGLRIFRVEDMPAWSDLFVLVNNQTVTQFGMDFLNLLQSRESD